MFDSSTPRSVSRVLTSLTKRHAKQLATDENFVAACAGFAADQPHPESKSFFERKKKVSRDEQLSIAGAAHLRLAAVRAALAMGDEEFTELQRSPDGYLLALTEHRLFVFDGSGTTYITESQLEGIYLQVVDHSDGMFTLSFQEGDERVAIATRRESEAATKHFVSQFPDRRSQPRVIHVADQTIADFS